MVRVIPFCSPVAELCLWLHTPKLSGVDRSVQTTQVHINSPRMHWHTPPDALTTRLRGDISLSKNQAVVQNMMRVPL